MYQKFTVVLVIFLLVSCSGGTDQFDDNFLGNWKKSKGDYYFNGYLEKLSVIKEGNKVFVWIDCQCDVKGKYSAEYLDGKLRVNIPFKGDAYAAWIEKGKTLNFLGDEFKRAGQ